MVSLANVLQTLRRDPRILKAPPYLSALCIIIGVAWLLLLPLNDYSRRTYISENALLPGQVHTYFGGSEHNVFRAYRHEVSALSNEASDVIAQTLGDIFKSQGLKVARQKYKYTSAGRTHQGENVYGVLRGPRADATEAIVLVAAWRNMDSILNQSGVALVVTLARYFKRWSLWSKDIFFVITEDSTAGPQAWVDAYHDAHNPDNVESLAIKGGALQGAIVVDYTAGPGGRRFEKLHIFYDGVNGQLANLDLFNTVVNIANTQVGMGCTIQRMWDHFETYENRLETMLRSMISQGVGHASGPHSSFIPYHVDALTLQTVGDGPHDEMSLGRVVEGTVRSLNNLLEHLHQSFFFYLLMQSNRFVSIGTYLPSAMLIAINFTITSMTFWIHSGRSPSGAKPASKASVTSEKSNLKAINSQNATADSEQEDPIPTVERRLFLPITLISLVHFLGLVGLKTFRHIPEQSLVSTFLATAVLTLSLPHLTARALTKLRPITLQEAQLLTSFSTLLLGICLATLSTLNFSLSLLLGLLAAPLSFIHAPARPSPLRTYPSAALLLALSPPVLLLATAHYQRPVSAFAFLGQGLSPLALRWAATQQRLHQLLAQAAFAYAVSGTWTLVVVWLVWWPAWVVGAVVGSPLLGVRR